MRGIGVHRGRSFFFVARVFFVAGFFVVRFFFALAVLLFFRVVAGFVGFLFLGLFRFVGMQFIHGRKLRAQAGREREFVDFHGAVEIRIWLARAPGRGNCSFLDSIGDGLER